MKLEDQVCSLELAKRLRELGVKQESYFYWGGTGKDEPEWELRHFSKHWPRDYSAFTVAELGEMLPVEVDTFKGNNECKWECSYHSGNDYYSKSGAITEANARAKMLIYLIENKLIEIP